MAGTNPGGSLHPTSPIRPFAVFALIALAIPPSARAQSSTRPATDHPDPAAVALDQAIADHPNDVSAILRRAAYRDGRRQWAAAIADYDRAVALKPDGLDGSGLFQRRGLANFRAGRIDASIADFDRFLKHHPDEAPQHWQRGLALHYAGRYAEGRRQFESHQTVNPNDVENSAWHYLCVARLEGVEKARAALIPTGGDRRVPMMQVHALFAGKATPADVLAAAKGADPKPDERGGPLFYAHLYLGLYHEAAGDAAQAKEHLLLAEKQAGDDYMGDTARVHAERLRAGATTRPAGR